MFSSERTEFEQHLGTLCAGFNVPATELRSDAYWRGLAKMQLSQFVRTVEFALSDEGPERIPTVPQVWTLWKSLRNRRPKAPSPTAESPPAFDSFHGFGQRCLLEWLRLNGPVPDAAVAPIVAEKNRLLEQFRSLAAECEVTADEVRESLFRAFRTLARPAA